MWLRSLYLVPETARAPLKLLGSPMWAPLIKDPPVPRAVRNWISQWLSALSPLVPAVNTFPGPQWVFSSASSKKRIVIVFAAPLWYVPASASWSDDPGQMAVSPYFATQSP